MRRKLQRKPARVAEAIEHPAAHVLSRGDTVLTLIQERAGFLPVPQIDVVLDAALVFDGDGDALAAVAGGLHDQGGSRVLRGLGLPTAQIPPICSMGGIGGFTHTHLVPTLAMISGPWSLYAPSFARRAIDFKRMRSQLLAIGDAALALDEIPREQIAGDYLGFREQRAQGAATCPPPENLPQFAPGPG